MIRHENAAEDLGPTVNGGPVAPAGCNASGWAMGLGCLSGDRSIVCPCCDRVVEALPHRRFGRGVAVFADDVGQPAATVLVNCAGVVEDTAVRLSSVDQWNLMLRQNLTSAFVMTTAFAHRSPTGGAVVNVGSVDAHYGNPGRAGYAVAKGGIEVFTRLAASQLAPRLVRVNVVIPGAIATRMTPDPEAGELCLLRRRGTAAEVASAIAFLASDEASYITGTALRVDGGFELR